MESSKIICEGICPLMEKKKESLRIQAMGLGLTYDLDQ